MEFLHHALFAFLCFCLVLVGSHASSPAEAYWKSVLPNTPIPEAMRYLIQPDAKITHTSNIDSSLVDLPYNDAASTVSIPKEQLKELLNQTNFFFEEDLHPGKKMTLLFAKTKNEATFLPDKVAQSIPFSSTKLPEIFSKFSVDAESMEAEKLKYTVEVCEKPGIKGEDKYCATSLESLVDYTVSKLGKNVQVLITQVEKETKKQQYNVVKRVQKVGDRAVVCHKLNYAYAVFYCHEISETSVYSVPLVAADDTKAKAAAVCHLNTANWNAKHLAFKELQVKPGTVPVCHFLVPDTLVWVPN
ncbi:BURP domain protein RD22 [Quillaja saponaria]|uniref:BURP domain protein RD22 n=1 Tax=Quillaja saponaria TaxID=32244 RepID=A0AAD7QJ01_QUISA|nr:BURP domain protein RD22 [Quillaja saponaria]